MKMMSITNITSASGITFGSDCTAGALANFMAHSPFHPLAAEDGPESGFTLSGIHCFQLAGQIALCGQIERSYFAPARCERLMK
jgi:hypothetical protein